MFWACATPPKAKTNANMTIIANSAQTRRSFAKCSGIMVNPLALRLFDLFSQVVTAPSLKKRGLVQNHAGMGIILATPFVVVVSETLVVVVID